MINGENDNIPIPEVRSRIMGLVHVVDVVAVAEARALQRLDDQRSQRGLRIEVDLLIERAQRGSIALFNGNTPDGGHPGRKTMLELTKKITHTIVAPENCARYSNRVVRHESSHRVPHHRRVALAQNTDVIPTASRDAPLELAPLATEASP